MSRRATEAERKGMDTCPVCGLFRHSSEPCCVMNQRMRDDKLLGLPERSALYKKAITMKTIKLPVKLAEDTIENASSRHIVDAEGRAVALVTNPAMLDEVKQALNQHDQLTRGYIDAMNTLTLLRGHVKTALLMLGSSEPRHISSVLNRAINVADNTISGYSQRHTFEKMEELVRLCAQSRQLSVHAPDLHVMAMALATSLAAGQKTPEVGQ